MTNGEKFKEVFGFGADGSRVIAVNATWWDSEFQSARADCIRAMMDARLVNPPQDPDIWNLSQEVVAMHQDLEKCKKDIETIEKAISPMLMAEVICRMKKE